MATHVAPVGPFPPGVDEDAYDRLRRRVLWSFPMGLYLVGSRDGDELNLMTANWAMQVSIKPKQVAVSVENLAVTHRLIAGGGVFTVCLLATSDRAEVRRFVKPAAHDAAARTLNGMPYRQATTGAPIPAIAAAWVECEVRQALEAGSHTVFIGEVVDVGAAEELESAGILRMADTRMSYGG